MKFRQNLALGLGFAILGGGVLQAGYVDVTVADPHQNKQFTPGVSGGSQKPVGLPEDNTVEWNAVANQTWDLESFKVDSSAKKLSMSGGFNFTTGKGYNGDGIASGLNNTLYQMGDIFVYVDTGVPYTTPNLNDTPIDHNGPWAGAGDWSYIIAFERDSNGNIKVSGGNVNYVILDGSLLDNSAKIAAASLTPGGSGILNENLPWKWSGNNFAGASVATYSTSAGAQSANKDTWVNEISNISLPASLNSSNEIYLHTTMRCGNDVLWGHASVPDGGLTVGMLGLSLLGLRYARHKIA